MSEAEVTCILDGLKFPEGPRWRDGKLWFSDFYQHRVLTVDEAGHAETVVEVENQPSGLGWDPSGRLLVVSMLDRKLLRLGDDGLEEVADLSSVATGNCNDMVVDAEGRAYVGNFGFDSHGGEAFKPATLARVDPDGSVHEAAKELAFPNGSAITADGKTLIVGETWGRCLTAFDIAADGSLSNRRVWADLGDNVPDGICLDEEGAIWVANPRANKVLRVFEGGRIEREISTGAKGAFACMLGGADGRTLFVCTADASGAKAAAATSGRIETVRVDAARVGLP